MTDSTMLSAGMALLGGIVWMVRLEGKVSGHELMFAERESRALERHNALLARFDAIDQRLARIPGAD